MTYSQSLYKRYDDKLDNILNYITTQIDLDDLYESVITGEKSEKYTKVQELLNGMVDEFELFYLYSVFVRGNLMVNICSATSAEERAKGEEDMPLLDTSDGYPAEELKKFSAAIAKDEISFFEENSEWGYAYTACKPLVTSTKVHYGLICADIAINDLHMTVNNYVLYNVILTLGLGILFGLILIVWLRHNVTGPILALERSARLFAEKSRDKKKDPKDLVFEVPEINTHNEVESLSNAIAQMSKDMKNYVEDILEAEETVKTAQEAAANMTMLAYKDALTHVGSKIAYDNAARTLEKDVAEKLITEFGIAMIDLNNLKVINDSYGHASGNTYIAGACHIVCTIFRHSPVFRVGGDEFIVILKNGDYENRHNLVEKANLKFYETENDNAREPWERFSVAIGMAEYRDGESVDAVFKRADEAMYLNKQKMKKNRK
ncbi:GGDEF domain-containing protein [Fibrobacter sp.]|uniref:GGDEF domain-containing protein n=1 Tax=Fibrobacter sp. TaxID=35828 RepID=UPI003869D851